MFCPKCGSVLTWRWDQYMKRDIFHCAPGEMPTSVHLTEQLLERFGAQTPVEEPKVVPPYPIGWQGRFQWYCPGCGVRLHEGLKCGRCGQSLQDLHRMLVELHPHLGE
jgi:hypothetical protein